MKKSKKTILTALMFAAANLVGCQDPQPEYVSPQNIGIEDPQEVYGPPVEDAEPEIPSGAATETSEQSETTAAPSTKRAVSTTKPPAAIGGGLHTVAPLYGPPEFEPDIPDYPNQ